MMMAIIPTSPTSNNSAPPSALSFDAVRATSVNKLARDLKILALIDRPSTKSIIGKSIRIKRVGTEPLRLVKHSEHGVGAALTTKNQLERKMENTKLKPMKKFVAYYYFVSWGCLSLGAHLCLNLPNIEIHLPFGFVRIGWVETYGKKPINHDSLAWRVFGLHHKYDGDQK